MIPNQWYAVLESKEVKQGRLLGATRLGRRLVFYRDAAGRAVCLEDLCVHRGAALSAGRLRDGCVECPFHGFRYDATGRVVLIPANGRTTPVPEQFRVRSYPTAEKNGMVFVWWGDAEPDMAAVPGFDELDSGFSFLTFVDHWPVHYSRAIENQLDLVHLPFVHHNTIGRGNRSLVNGPVEEVRGRREILFWVFNEPDRGQGTKKAALLPAPNEARQHIHFMFPSIWQNWITHALRIFVAFVPVDEENTLIYMRTCQRFVRIPVLRRLVDLIMRRFSVVILRQDKRVVVTQLPKKTELRMGEKLIPGDLPIVTYRKIREELKNPLAGQKG